MENRDKIKEYENRMYATHPEYAEHRKNYAKDRYASRREFIDTYKVTHGCIDCGYNAEACALQFDHRDPSIKEFTIAEGTNLSLDKLIAEINKCDIRCANCHLIKTRDRGENGPRRGRPLIFHKES